MYKVLTAAAALAFVASSALAADLPTMKAPPAPAFIPPPLFTWTGFYVGLNGGGAWGSMRGASNGLLADPNGGMIGGTVGYNYQISQFVVGYEGDVDLVGGNWLSGKHTNAAGAISTVRVDDGLVTERLRVGYSFDRALVFLTGGYAGADVDAAVVDPIRGALASENWSNGYVLGGGLEYAFTNNISAKAEYLFAGFGSHHYFSGADATNGSLDLSMFRVGVNYRF
jgi:outer membrane immunogenic protein